MSESQYKQYQNLYIFAKDWRKYKQISPLLDINTFRSNIQVNKYIRIECMNNELTKPVLIYLLLNNDKKNDINSQELKHLLAKIKDPSDVILVSSNKFKSHPQKVITSFKHLRVKTYLHENFDLIIPEGPLCYKHRILSHDEIKILLNKELCCSLINLPKILLEDVQCIWIGAEVGDVVEITMISDITLETIQYKVVTPKNSRVISFRNETNIIGKEEDDEDDEIIEHRENIADEDDIDVDDDIESETND